jgi:glycosyltransferase involved in cell wall biosynthesis
MNILLFAPLLGYWGGTEQYMVDCIQEFTRLGHSCSLVYGSKSTKPLKQGIAELLRGAYQISVLSEFESAEDALGVEHLNTILERERPDVIFMSGVRNFALLSRLRDYGGLVPMSHNYGLVCMRLANITYFRKKTCTHNLGCRCLLHGCFVRKKTYGGDKLIYNSVSKHLMLLEIYKSIGIHIVASNYVKNKLIQNGFQPEQVTVAGYFTDLKALPAVPLNEQRPITSFMGRIDRYKGVDYLLRALTRVSAPFRCSVIGDGPYLPYCKTLARKLGVSDVVDFVGWLSREEIAAHLRAVSMVIVPSIWPEAFGIVGIEAMMCSKPVVAFDAGGISDWLKDDKNGYLVPVKNTMLLAEKIEVLLRDPQTAANMGAEGYRLVTSAFSKEQHFERLFSVLGRAAVARTRTQQTFKILN